MSNLKAILMLISLVACLYLGYVVMQAWWGIVIGLLAWLIAVGSTGITKDIEQIAKKNK